MKRFLTGILALAFMLSGCGQAQQEAGKKELDEVSIVLDWYPNAVHGFIYDAIEKGYYEEEGIKVNILFPSNTNDAISMTAAGKADLGIYYMQDIILARANEGVPVKAVGTVLQQPLNVVISLAEKNIQSPKDLVGKRLGYGGGALSEATINTIIAHEGGDLSDVEVIDVGFDIISSMTTGNVDATLGGMINHEVPQMEEQGLSVNYFFPANYGMPNYYEMVFVTGESTLEQDRDKLARFLRASQKGFLDMKEDPDAVVQTLLAHQNAENFPLSQAVEEKGMEYLLPAMEREGAPFLSQELSVWQENIDWMKGQGLLTGEIHAEDLVENLLSEEAEE